MQSSHPYLVRVPYFSADETTMGEWLERRAVDYMTPSEGLRLASAYEFHFSSKQEADEFARNFVG